LFSSNNSNGYQIHCQLGTAITYETSLKPLLLKTRDCEKYPKITNHQFPQDCQQERKAL